MGSFAFRARARPYAALLTLATLAGCASLEAVPRYEPPAAATASHVAYVDREFERAWSGVVRGLAQSVFDFQQVSKESGLITIDLASDGLDDSSG